MLNLAENKTIMKEAILKELQAIIDDIECGDTSRNQIVLKLQLVKMDIQDLLVNDTED